MTFGTKALDRLNEVIGELHTAIGSIKCLRGGPLIIVGSDNGERPVNLLVQYSSCCCSTWSVRHRRCQAA